MASADSSAPAKPAYARVKVWRRLQGLGAVTVKGSVYALPANDETREDFAWLLRRSARAAARHRLRGSLVDGLSDSELQGLFDAARDEDYARIADEAARLRPASRQPADDALRRCRHPDGPAAQAARRESWRSISSAPRRARRPRGWSRASRPR